MNSLGNIFWVVSLSPNVLLPPYTDQHAPACSFYCNLTVSYPARSLDGPQFVYS